MPRRRYEPQISPPQLFLFGKIRSIYPDARLNYPILTDKTIRYADIAVFNEEKGLDGKKYKIVVEYDGFLSHRGRKKQDRERDLELLRAGWKTIRINKKNVINALDLIEAEINK